MTEPNHKPKTSTISTKPQSSKRRKNCPSALDRLQDLTPNSNRSFSFTFDTNSGGLSPKITPEFGSFNPGQWEMEGQKLGGEIREKEAEKAGEEYEEVKKEDDDEGEGVGIGDLASDVKLLESDKRTGIIRSAIRRQGWDLQS